jgi:tRNA 2-selenouridine synthase
MITKTGIEAFLELARQYPVFDVRSPGEYSHAHIPGAISLPLFNDEERKVVGTAYKQESRETAIKLGLDYFGVKMRKMVEEVEPLLKQKKWTKSRPDPDTNKKIVLVHCWRGGMRSAGVAWLLDLYGYKVYTLEGGYKAFRNWVLDQFANPFNFNIIGGYTGSGKTLVLQALQKAGHPTLDLEGMANHKGSAFGGLGKTEKPSQEMFENTLATGLHMISATAKAGQPIWLEDESRRIGDLNLPEPLWRTMRGSKLYFLDIPAAVRVDYIVGEYGKFKTEDLIKAILRIHKRLGGLATKQCVNYLIEGDHKSCFEILLGYYDKFYLSGMQDRENLGELMVAIPSPTVDATKNTALILAAAVPTTA